MPLIEVVVLGVLQGLTEFLPISSSGHLRLAPSLFGWNDAGAAFTAVVQLGTMAAVVLYFWSDLWQVGTAWLRSLTHPPARREPYALMGWYLILATLPIGVFGLVFEDQIETNARDVRVVASALIGFGLILAIADWVGAKRKSFSEINPREGIAIGLAQSLALIPGVSRSGATITAGLFAGYQRPDAARFSFLLSVPAVVLSGLFKLPDAAAGGAGLLPTAIGTILAFVTGYASIAWLLRWLGSHSSLIFVVYRVALGTLVWILILGDRLEPR